MKIICIGDVVGTVGTKAVAKVIPQLKDKYKADVIIANGENAGDTASINKINAEALFACGVDIITGGNHSLRSKDMSSLYERDCGIIRPANFHLSASGKGIYIYEKGKNRLAVINLIGNVFIDLAFESPFLCSDRLLKEIDCKNIVVDFHAEATAEKIALGKYLDGRISLCYGTHTHVPTADETIFDKGTAFITDIGMSGPIDSVLGIKNENSTQYMISRLHNKMEVAKGPCKVQGIFCETDDNTGKAIKIERFEIKDI